MNILVTGGAGFIGSHTCVELLESGYEITVVDNYSNSSSESLERVKKITGKNFFCYESDVRDESAMDQIFANHKFDAVIHFAGFKAVGESVQKPIEYYDNNINSLLILCRMMEKYDVKNIIFSSSATVYRGDNAMPLTEDSAVGECTNPYGWSKFMSEQVLKDAALIHPEWSVVLLRYFNPVGAHKSGMLGEDPSDIPNNLMPYISQTAIGRLKELSIFGADYDTPDGTGVRDYIHVVDLAKGHVSAIRLTEKSKGVSVVNLGTGKGTSVMEMVKAFERANKIEVPYKISERRAGDLAVCYADTKRAKEVLNWQAEKDLDDMVRDTWNWQKKNPNGYGKE